MSETAVKLRAGSHYASREALNEAIREQGKSKGYIFKQSVTSSTKVNWYCSNKYGGLAVKCLAGYKAQQQANGTWLILEAAGHNDACTRAREKILGRRISDIAEEAEDGHLEPGPIVNDPAPTGRGSASSATKDSLVAPPAKRRTTSRSLASVNDTSSALSGAPSAALPSVGNSAAKKGARRHSSASGRPRSYSATSTNTTASSTLTDKDRLRTPSLFNGSSSHKTTILDPAYHFPGVDLENVSIGRDVKDIEAWKAANDARKRKRGNAGL